MRSVRSPENLTFVRTGRGQLIWVAVCLIAIALIIVNVGDLTIYIGEEARTLVPRVVFILPFITPFAIALAHAAYAWNPRAITFDRKTRTLTLHSRRVCNVEDRTVGFDDIARVIARENLSNTETVVVLTSGEEVLIDRDERVDPAARSSAQAQTELITGFLKRTRDTDKARSPKVGP